VNIYERHCQYWLEYALGKQYDLEQVRYNCSAAAFSIKRDLPIDGRKPNSLGKPLGYETRPAFSSGVRRKELIRTLPKSTS
jgi:hypothetical protein